MWVRETTTEADAPNGLRAGERQRRHTWVGFSPSSAGHGWSQAGTENTLKLVARRKGRPAFLCSGKLPTLLSRRRPRGNLNITPIQVECLGFPGS
jgi:hypothetical protein